MLYKKMSDEELVKVYQNGDPKGFEVLFKRYKLKINSYIYLTVRNRELTEDLFQDTFVKVIKTLSSGNYNHEDKFLSWVLRIAHNVIIDHFRVANRMPEKDIYFGDSDEEKEKK